MEITNDLKVLLRAQAEHEADASQLYDAIAWWADLAHWRGMEKFARANRKEELGHSNRVLNLLTNYVQDSVVSPEVGAMSMPSNTTLLSAMQQIVKAEQENTKQWRKIKQQAEKDGMGDISAWSSEFLMDQIKSVSEVQDLLQLVTRAGTDQAALEMADHTIGTTA